MSLTSIIAYIRNGIGYLRSYREETLEDFRSSLLHIDSVTPDVSDVSHVAKAIAQNHIALATIVELTNILEYMVKGLLYMQRVITEGIESAYKAKEKLPLPWVTNTLKAIKEVQ